MSADSSLRMASRLSGIASQRRTRQRAQADSRSGPTRGLLLSSLHGETRIQRGSPNLPQIWQIICAIAKEVRLMNADESLSPGQAGRLLSVSAQTIRNWVKEGKLPA